MEAGLNDAPVPDLEMSNILDYSLVEIREPSLAAILLNHLKDPESLASENPSCDSLLDNTDSSYSVELSFLSFEPALDDCPPGDFDDTYCIMSSILGLNM